MFNAEIIFAGGEKESYYKEAANEYIKRLGAYCDFHEKVVKDERLSDSPSDAEISAALAKEGAKIMGAVSPRNYKVAMCIEGKQMSSEELAHLVGELPMMGYSGISFIIGSSEGLSDDVKRSCNLRLSMSKMTFPHRLARVMLLEQLYRAFNIASGGKYHK